MQLPFSLVDTSCAKQLQENSKEKNSLTMVYDVLGRGILTGKYTSSSIFSGTDTRSEHKYFKGKNLEKNLNLVKKLENLAEKYGVSLAQVAIKWVVDMGFIDVTLVGCKTPEQVLTNVNIFDFNLSDDDSKVLSHLARK